MSRPSFPKGLLAAAALLVAAAVYGALDVWGDSFGGVTLQAQTLDRSVMPSLLYGDRRSAIAFSHRYPPHAQLRCVQCHNQSETSTRASDSLTPSEATCTPCHETGRNAAPTSTRPLTPCAFCHEGYGQENGQNVPASSLPTPRIKFSHRAHVALGMRCLSCHEGVDDEAKATPLGLPKMDSCMQCHGAALTPALAGETAEDDGVRRPVASGECSTCHLTRPDGGLVTRFDEGELVPGPSLPQLAHDADWIVRHRWKAADDSSTCASCHAENECQECHNDSSGVALTVHGAGFIAAHGREAARTPTSCTSCHALQSFCVECHQTMGMSAFSPGATRGGTRFHPAYGDWVEGQNLHATEAERNLGDCVSCHAERDCVQCHGAVGIGTGARVHGPSFRSECETLKRASEAACVQCHGRNSGIACDF